MELTSFQLKHFRRFFEEDNEVVFANTDKSNERTKLQSTLIVGQNNADKAPVTRVRKNIFLLYFDSNYSQVKEGFESIFGRNVKEFKLVEKLQ